MNHLGFFVDQLGFGRNLLADSPTLAASIEDFEAKLHTSAEQMKYLWHYPTLSKGIAFNNKSNELSLGVDQYTLPLLLFIDGDMDVCNK